jgi:GTP cyclohydrolase I
MYKHNSWTLKKSIGYLPICKFLVLSKLARIVQIFTVDCKERLTKQIAQTVFEAVNPHEVAVILEFI